MLIFPPEIATTNLRPDIVLWSGSACIVQLIELTVQWDDAVDEAYETQAIAMQCLLKTFDSFFKYKQTTLMIRLFSK